MPSRRRIRARHITTSMIAANMKPISLIGALVLAILSGREYCRVGDILILGGSESEILTFPGLCTLTHAMMEEEPSVNISAILNQFMVGYDKRVRPNYGGIPVTVGVSLYILSIGDLSEKYMDFTFDMYFRQFWKDPRLSFDERPNLKKLVVGAEYIKGSFKNLFH